MDAEDVKQIDAALSRHLDFMMGLIYAQGMLIRELIDQQALDEVKFLEQIRHRRMQIADANHSELFGLGFAALAATVLQSGKCQLPADWMAKLTGEMTDGSPPRLEPF